MYHTDNSKINNYLKYIRKQNYKNNTLKQYYYRLREVNKISKNLYNLDIDMINSRQLLEILAEMKDGETSNRTINTTLSAIKSFYDWLILMEYRENNIVVNSMYSKVDKYKGNYIDFKDFIYLLEKCVNNKLDFIAFVILYSSGIRLQELINLKQKNIKIIDDQILEIEIMTSKNRRSRIVRTIKVNDIYLGLIYEDYLKNVTIKKNDLEPFCDCYSRLHKAIYKLNLDTNNFYTIHDLRRTYATNLYKNKIDIVTISKILGHSSINTTFNYILIDTTAEKTKNITLE